MPPKMHDTAYLDPNPPCSRALHRVLQGPTLQQGRHLGLPLVLQGVEKVLECHQVLFKGKMHVELGAAELLREATNLHCKNALEKKGAQKVVRFSCRQHVPISRSDAIVNFCECSRFLGHYPFDDLVFNISLTRYPIGS